MQVDTQQHSEDLVSFSTHWTPPRFTLTNGLIHYDELVRTNAENLMLTLEFTWRVYVPRFSQVDRGFSNYLNLAIAVYPIKADDPLIRFNLFNKDTVVEYDCTCDKTTDRLCVANPKGRRLSHTPFIVYPRLSINSVSRC
jgi:hypothetical protein